ncbi:MAG TPA: hypothetical protein VGU22_04025 [Methylomirabilota bacterium]|jgi:photosystem II stability/assembly factor-like uncharacterized protein|nr:hypothetical protein [Methylomirabilota bacterium]
MARSGTRYSRRPEPEVQERDRREVREVRAEVAERFGGKIALTTVLGAIERARAHRAALIELPRAAVDPDRVLRGAADLVGAEGATVKATPARRERLALGGTGRFVTVAAKRPFNAATLRFKLSARDIRQLEPETLIVARWNDVSGRFHAVPQSGYNRRFGYAYARIGRPGVYSAVGLPRDPRGATTIRLLNVLREWMPLDDQLKLTLKVCGLILCAPGLARAIPAAAATLGFNPSDFVGGPAGRDICELCLGRGGRGDLGIPDVLGIGGFGERPPIPPPWTWPWPRPCRKWESMGPDNVPGRIRALAIDPTIGTTIYAGSAAGGVFKTTNAGVLWSTTWETQLSLAIGGVAVAPSNPNVIYAATGEWDVSVAAIYVMYPGVGVYRSDNAGATWRRLAPIPSTQTAAVAVDPGNPDRVFVAGGNGVHRSTNGGQTWDLAGGNTQGVFDGVVSDVVLDPSDVNRLYIGVHHSATRTGGVYRSLDGGNSWTLLTNGILSGVAADGPKIALGRTGTHGTQFVAVKMSNQVFTSVDGGTTFTQQPLNAGFNAGQSRYMNVIAVDPTNEAIVFGGDFNLYRSTNGGVTWTNVSTSGAARKNRIHEDVHALVFDPANHNTVFVASDNGIYTSLDNGQTWDALHGAADIPADPIVSSNLVTLQCWTVAVSQTPQLAFAVTTHDNYSYKWSAGRAFINTNYVFRGEGGWIEYDPTNEAVIYSDNWYSNAVKTTNGTAFWQAEVWTDLGIDTSNLNLEAFSIGRVNPARLLAITRPSGVVVRSTTGGAPFATVLSVMGEEISAVQFAPSDDNHAYAASVSGRVWHSTDAGATWTELARVALPNARVHDIEVDWTDPLRVHLAFGTRGALGVVGFRQLWRGAVGAGTQATWVDVSGALPAVSLPDLGLTGLALDPTVDNTIYVSNIIGVYRSTDGGDSWHPFDEGLPNTFVSDLDIRKPDRTLWVSTMGRGVYRRVL